jgi:hypothetical protein
LKLPIKRKKEFVGEDKLPRNNGTLKKVMRYLLYIFILWIILRGIGSIVNNDAARLNDAAMRIDNFLENPPARLEDDLTMQAKAKEVMFEYLTYKGRKEERNKRVNALIFRRIDETFDSNIKEMQPLDIQVLNVEPIKEDEVCVSLQATYEVTKSYMEGDEEKEEKEEKEVFKSYYKVSVIKDTVGTKVKDIPLLIPSTGVAEKFNQKAVKYASADLSVKHEIEDSLKSFYKAYYEGTQKDISYVTTIENLKGLESQAKFQALNTTEARIGESGEAFVVSEIRVKDEFKTYNQKYELVLIKEKDKYLVESIDLVNKDFVNHYEEELENE